MRWLVRLHEQAGVSELRGKLVGRAGAERLSEDPLPSPPPATREREPPPSTDEPLVS